MRCSAALSAVAALMAAGAIATPIHTLMKRQDQPVNRNVYITRDDDLCILAPRYAGESVQQSFQTNHTNTACWKKKYNDAQFTIPDDFWVTRQVDGTPGRVKRGRQVELAACIDPTKLNQFTPSDQGGVYSSFGGVNNLGAPEGATCLGYDFFFQVVEPSAGRLCMRCCREFEDCNDLDLAAQGCPSVIPGDYSKCGAPEVVTNGPGRHGGLILGIDVDVNIDIGLGIDINLKK